MLFQMSTEAQTRRFAVIGMSLTAVITLAVALVILNPLREKPTDEVSVLMVVPFVGQGIAAGSPLLMHGVEVGQVTDVASLPSGKVQLAADVKTAPTAHLTDALTIDYRPANYFGVTGINLVAGEGGNPLRDGMQLETAPRGNFTLQALLSRLGEITGGVVTPQLISVLNRATRYTDALNPLIETFVTAADALAQVQNVSTEQLLRNTTGISVAFPGFVADATAAGYSMNQGAGLVNFNVDGRPALPGQAVTAVPGDRVTEEFWKTRGVATLDVIANSFFGSVGKLVSSHTNELLPAVDLIKTLTDTVPALLAPEGINDTMVELRRRLEALYAGSPEQRALQVHIVLDNIPGVQAPINAMGGP